MHFQNVVLEVTRKCNLKCEHCLRGSAQNLSIQDNVLHFLAKEEIGQLHLSGGEPSLVPDIFKRFIQYRIFPNDISVITNGKVFRKQFLTDFKRFADLLKYKDCSYFGVSVDEFHSSGTHGVLACYKDHGDYLCIGIMEHCKYLNTAGLYSDGRAASFTKPNLINVSSGWSEKDPNDRTIYITVKGDVLYGCDWSFKRMDRLILGNITRNSLETIVERSEKTYYKHYKKIIKTPYNELDSIKPGEPITY